MVKEGEGAILTYASIQAQNGCIRLLTLYSEVVSSECNILSIFRDATKVHSWLRTLACFLLFVHHLRNIFTE